MDGFETVTELASRIRSREFSATELIRFVLERVEKINPRLNAIVTLDREGAVTRAREADDALARGQIWGPLHGVPFTLKDCHETAGMRTTVGFPPLADYVPQTDGTIAARLRGAGAILIGKTNVPPMLVGQQTNNEVFGRTNNPWNLERTAGGSSGGAASAIAAGLVPFDIGSDMVGSIRLPAHFCGIFGLKPTQNRVSATGHIPPAPGAPKVDRRLPVSGPMARSAGDLALLMQTISGPDGSDFDVPPIAWQPAPRVEPERLRLAFSTGFAGVPVAAAVRNVMSELVRKLGDAGVHLEEREPGFSLEELDAIWKDYFRIVGALMRDTGSSVSSKIAGRQSPSALDLVGLLDARDRLIAKLEALLTEFDAYVCPATITTAFSHSPKRAPVPVDGALVDAHFIDSHLYPFNFTGNPALVVPVALADDGLPVGAQLVGPRWADERLVAIGAAVAEIGGSIGRPREDFASTS